MQKQEIITALGLFIFANDYGSFKEWTSLPHQEFSEPEIEFSEFEIQENVKKDTVFKEYPRSLKSNRQKSGLRNTESTFIHKVIRTLHQNIKMNSESKLILDEIRQLNSKNKKILKSIEPERKDFKKSKTEYQVYLELKLKNPSPHTTEKKK